jgi:hypothetical protein
MRSGALVRLYRPKAVIAWAGYFTVFLDGAERGELWGDQVRVFEIAPGRHEVRVKQGWGLFQGSPTLPFEAGPGQAVEFACSRLSSVLGWADLHRATATESAKVRRYVDQAPAPRNLALPKDP